MQLLRCPLCHLPFQKNQSGIICANRHQFDRAKEGYFNLLPVQNKNSLVPGDTKEQLIARRIFLQTGLFDPLKIALLDLIDDSIKSLLDLGCGEGYFTRALAAHLPDTEIYGVDIAKAGMVMAAKAAKELPNITHVVASNFDLPLQDHSMNIIIRILAPSKDAELQRLLKYDGKLILVIPGEQHLVGLRNKIYQEIRPLQSLPEIEGFSLMKTANVQFDMDLKEPGQIQSLINMTPFSWKINQDKKDLILSRPLKDKADFIIGVYVNSRSEITPS